MQKCTFVFFVLCVVALKAQVLSPQTGVIDFERIKANIHLDTITSSIKGKLEATFTANKKVDSVWLDARGDYLISSKNSSNVYFKENKVVFKDNIIAGKTYTLTFDYEVTPKKAMYFWGWNSKRIDTTNSNRKQIWTQGQGKYTSHWLPSIDDMNDKMVFDLNITFNENYQVLSNALLTKSNTDILGSKSWQYTTQKPISSYLVALVIGKYNKRTSSTINGSVIENYIYPDRESDYESTYKYHQKIFDFLEFEIGVPYPWHTYRQVPLRDFLYAGMENVGCTTYDDDFIVDSNTFSEKNLVNISAHELAHQWFGNLVTEKDSKHHWLHEGFATFYALKAEQHIFGNDYYLFKLYENAELLERQNNTKSTTALVFEKANSLIYYQRGAWALATLEALVGKSTFKKIVKDFLNEFQLQNVTTTNFLGTVLKHTDKDISDWSKKWLYNEKFPTKEALQFLTTSNFMRQYLQLAGQRTQPLIGKYNYLSEALNFPVNPYLASEAVSQLQEERSPQAFVLLDKAFKTNHPLVLKTIAETFNEIPHVYEPKFRKLLESNSYETVELALYQLWNNFEQHQMDYLEITKSRIGDNNKNIRTAWLALALNTPGFTNEKRKEFREEMNRYTYANHPIGLRRFAFNFLAFSNTFTDQSLINLSYAATHPNWRFNKFCTDTIKNLLQSKNFKKRFLSLSASLPDKVQKLLTTN